MKSAYGNSNRNKKYIFVLITLFLLFISSSITVAGVSYPSLGACYAAKGYDIFNNLPPQNVKDDCITLTAGTTEKNVLGPSCASDSVPQSEFSLYPAFQKLTEADTKRIMASNLLSEAKSLRDSEGWWKYNSNKESDAKYKEGNAVKLRAEALQAYFDLLKSDPRDVAALIGVGQVRQQEGNYDLALQSFSKARSYADSDQLITIDNILSNYFLDKELKLDESIRQKQIESGESTPYSGTEEQIELLMKSLIAGRVGASDSFSQEARTSVSDYLAGGSNILSLVFMSPIKVFRLFPYPSVSGVDKFEIVSKKIAEENRAINTVLALEDAKVIKFTDLNSIDENKLSTYVTKTGVSAQIYRVQINRVKNSEIYNSISVTSQNGKFVLSAKQANIAQLKSSVNLVEGGKIVKTLDFIIPSPWMLIAADGGTRLAGFGHRFVYSRLPAYATTTDYLAGIASKSAGIIQKNLWAPAKNQIFNAFIALTKRDIALSMKDLEKPAQDRALSQLSSSTTLRETLQCFERKGNPFAYVADINKKVVNQYFIDNVIAALKDSPDQATFKLKMGALWKDVLFKESYTAPPEQELLLESYNRINFIPSQNHFNLEFNRAIIEYNRKGGSVRAANIFADQSKAAITSALDAFTEYVNSYTSFLEELKIREGNNYFLSAAEKKVRIAQIDEKILAMRLAKHDANNRLTVLDMTPLMFAERVDPAGDQKVADYLGKLLTNLETNGGEVVPSISLGTVSGENIYGNLVTGDFADIFAGQISSIPGKWGSKAIVYLDSSGSYHTIFFRTYISHQDVAVQLIRNDLLANRGFLMSLATGTERKEIETGGINGVNTFVDKISAEIMKKNYRPGILSKIASYQMQFDPESSLLTVTLEGATTTDLQIAKKIAVNHELINSLEKNIAKSLLPQDKPFVIGIPDGLKIE